MASRQRPPTNPLSLNESLLSSYGYFTELSTGETVRYRLVRLLGRGTYGDVWLASTDDNAEIAVKIPNPVFVLTDAQVSGHAVREIQTLIRTRAHPNVVSLIGIDESGHPAIGLPPISRKLFCSSPPRDPSMVFPLAATSLHTEIRSFFDHATRFDLRPAPWTPSSSPPQQTQQTVAIVCGWLARVCGFLRGIASAIAHCHHNAVLHRDLKPANVLLERHVSLLTMDHRHLDQSSRGGLLSTGATQSAALRTATDAATALSAGMAARSSFEGSGMLSSAASGVPRTPSPTHMGGTRAGGIGLGLANGSLSRMPLSPLGGGSAMGAMAMSGASGDFGGFSPLSPGGTARVPPPEPVAVLPGSPSFQERMLALAGECETSVKVGDFGLARGILLPIPPYNAEVQSLWYRAPERLMGYPGGPAMDVWSLGCVLAECIAGWPILRPRKAHRATLNDGRAACGEAFAPLAAVYGPAPRRLSEDVALQAVAVEDMVGDGSTDEGGWLGRSVAEVVSRMPLLSLVPAAWGEQIVLLLRAMLSVDSSKRPTAAEVASSVALRLWEIPVPPPDLPSSPIVPPRASALVGSPASPIGVRGALPGEGAAPLQLARVPERVRPAPLVVPSGRVGGPTTPTRTLFGKGEGSPGVGDGGGLGSWGAGGGSDKVPMEDDTDDTDASDVSRDQQEASMRGGGVTGWAPAAAGSSGSGDHGAAVKALAGGPPTQPGVRNGLRAPPDPAVGSSMDSEAL